MIFYESVTRDTALAKETVNQGWEEFPLSDKQTLMIVDVVMSLMVVVSANVQEGVQLESYSVLVSALKLCKRSWSSLKFYEM